MAVREFKFQITSTEGNEEFYVWDNNAQERVTLPAINPVEHIKEHTDFFCMVTCYLRKHKGSKLEVTKV